MRNNLLLALVFVLALLSFTTFPKKPEILDNRIEELHTNEKQKSFDSIYENKYLTFGRKTEQFDNRIYEIIMLGVEVKDSLPTDQKVKELAARYKYQLDEMYDDNWYGNFEIIFNKKETHPVGYTVNESKSYVIKD